MRDRAASNRKGIHERKDMILGVCMIIVLYFVFHVIGIGCPIRWLTGIPCAGCGMTRAYISLLHFDIRQAFFYHPLFWTVPIAILVCALHRLHKIPEKCSKIVLGFLAFLFLAVYLYRLSDPRDLDITARIQDGFIYRFWRNIFELFS